jgi:hypothetical protein
VGRSPASRKLRIRKRNHSQEDLGCGIAHKAGKLASGTVLQATARRISDFRQLECHRVHERRVAATMLYQHGMIAHRHIEIMPIDRESPPLMLEIGPSLSWLARKG